jgi:hypothetical protein
MAVDREGNNGLEIVLVVGPNNGTVLAGQRLPDACASPGQCDEGRADGIRKPVRMLSLRVGHTCGWPVAMVASPAVDAPEPVGG